VISLRTVDVAVIGGGPAGLSAANEAARHGAAVCLIDRQDRPGGQLIKQTHRFFGSGEQYAGVRGIDIAGILVRQVEETGLVELALEATALGCFEDGVLLYEQRGEIRGIKPRCLVLATGAQERSLAFPGADLPGVYGAGAVQTLMNVYGVRPGRRAVMVGAGNIGLIVSYQLLQAGVEVACILEAMPQVGGYWVHAAKVRRQGVPIHTSHTVTRAHGEDRVQAVSVVEIDENWKPRPGTERLIECDVLCLAVGLEPLADLLWQAGCGMVHSPALGGYVAQRSRSLETTVSGIFVAGDAAGIEEASSAMVEGRLAGLGAAQFLGLLTESQAEDLRASLIGALDQLRAGPVGAKIRAGLAALEKGAVRSQRLAEGEVSAC